MAGTSNNCLTLPDVVGDITQPSLKSNIRLKLYIRPPCKVCNYDSLVATTLETKMNSKLLFLLLIIGLLVIQGEAAYYRRRRSIRRRTYFRRRIFSWRRRRGYYGDEDEMAEDDVEDEGNDEPEIEE